MDDANDPVHAHETIADILHRWGAVETWAPAPEFPLYEVSTHGCVRNARLGRVLSPAITRGYCRLSLCRDGEIKNMTVHRLVALTFLGPPPFADAIVAHNDGVATNNMVTNLRWASAKENQQDACRHNSRAVGSRVGGAKLVEDQIPVIRERLRSGEHYAAVAADYGVSKHTIWQISKGLIWKQTGGSAWPKMA